MVVFHLFLICCFFYKYVGTLRQTMNTLKYLLPTNENLHIWITAILMITGLLFLNWNPKIVIFAYLFETVIIGLIHLVKMFFVVSFSQKNERKSSEISGYMSIPFFFFHYFFFIAIQMVFVFSFINIDGTHLSKGPFELFKNFGYLFSLPDMKEAYLVIIMNNIFHTIKTFFIPRKYLESTVEETFMQPYLRVFVQQFVAILGGFFFLFSGATVVIAILLIVLRTFVDLIGVSMPHNPKLKEKIIYYMLQPKDGILSEKDKKDKRIIEKMFE